MLIINFNMINNDDYVKNVYEEIAKHFSNTRKQRWIWVDNFINNLPSNSLIYDLGCGNGRNMEFKDKIFIGIDTCKNFINICRIKNLNVVEASIINLPFQNNSADYIISIAVFHHLSDINDRIKALNEMYRVLKDNGEILLSIWSINQPKKTKKNFKLYGDNIVLWNSYGKIYKRYYYIFKIDEIQTLFKISNFEIISHIYDCGNEIFKLKKIKVI